MRGGRSKTDSSRQTLLSTLWNVAGQLLGEDVLQNGSSVLQKNQTHSFVCHEQRTEKICKEGKGICGENPCFPTLEDMSLFDPNNG